MRPSLIAAYIAIAVYKKDIIKFIQTEVKKNISALETSEEDGDHLTAKTLKADLTKWNNVGSPLDYANGVLLMRLVNPDGTSLPPASEPRLNIDSFSQRLVTLAIEEKLTGAPFISKAQFQHVLPCAVQKLLDFGSRLKEDPSAHAADCIKRAILSIKLHMLPWSPPHPPGTRGRPHVAPSLNAWVTFGAMDPTTTSIPLRPREHRSAAMQSTMDQLQNSDQNAPWSAIPLRVSDLHKYLSRRVLPDDYKPPTIHASPDGSTHVKDTYEYIARNIDLVKPLHRLSLLLAIIFSKVCPNVFTEASTADLTSRDLHHSDVSAQEYLNTLPWLNRLDAGKRGNTQRDSYLSMVTTYILAIYDPNSPIRVYHNQKGQFGRWWTEKHSQSIISQSLRFIY